MSLLEEKYKIKTLGHTKRIQAFLAVSMQIYQLGYYIKNITNVAKDLNRKWSEMKRCKHWQPCHMDFNFENYLWKRNLNKVGVKFYIALI